MKIFKIILFMVLILCSVSLYAQNVKIGIGGGANFSSPSLTTDYPQPDIAEKDFPRVSIFADFKIYKSFWLATSVGYIEHGYSYLDFTSYYIQFNYINTEIDIKYKYNTFYALLGTSFGFFQSGQSDLGLGVDKITSDHIESTNIAMNLGGGFEFPISKKFDLFIQADYAIGFTDVVKDSDSVLKLRGLSLQGGIKYGF